MELSVVLLSSLVAAISGSDTNLKTWIPNTNYGNPRNWDLGRLPCEKDSVIFPSGLDIGVALPEGRTAIRELVLSKNGEIILPLNGVLELGGGTREESTASCAGQDIAFIRSGARGWLDPANWQTGTEPTLATGVSPVPHLDRIPCEHDVVQFEAGASFKLQLPEVDVVVGKIKFGDKEMSDAEWAAWLNTDSGFRQFVGRWGDRPTAVTIQPPDAFQCLDKAGCACNRRYAQRLLQHVCAFQAPRCPPPTCYSPVTPRGHCCPICGAVLLVKHDAEFDIVLLQRLLADYLKDDKYSGIMTHARKTAEEQDYVQVVIVERGGYQGTSGELATQLADDILKDMELGVKKITVSSAGPMILGSKLVSAVKTMFGTFVAVAVFLGMMFYVFVVYKKGLPFGAANYQLFQFARFENAHGDDDDGVLAIGSDQLALPTAGSDEDSPSKSFDNPMYGKSSVVSEGVGFQADSASAGSVTTHQNPIYSELKKREDDAKEDDKAEETDTDTDDDSDDSDGDSQSIVENTEGETTFHEVSFEKVE